MTERLDKRILHGLFRIFCVGQNGHGYAEHTPLMLSYEGFKGSAISTHHQLDQSEVILAANIGSLGVFVHSQTMRLVP